MPEMTKSADAIIVPVLPSDIDIHACSNASPIFLMIAGRCAEQPHRPDANRVRRNTVIYRP